METFSHVGFLSGIVAGIGGVIAEVSTSDVVSQGGLWIGIAGLITAIGSVLKEWWNDRKAARELAAANDEKERDFKLKKLRIQLRAHQNQRVFVALYRWAGAIREKVPDLPALPELPSGYEAAADAPVVFEDDEHPRNRDDE